MRIMASGQQSALVGEELDTSGLSVRNAATASFVKNDTQSDSPLADVESDMVTDVSNLAASWASSLRKGVHFSEAVQLIQTLLINAMPTKDIAEEDCDKAAASDVEEDIPTLVWRPDDMRALLQRSQVQEPNNESLAKRRRIRSKSSHTQALSIVESVWGHANTSSTNSDKKNSGPRHIREAATHVAARNAKNSAELEIRPFSKNRLPSATLYPMDTAHMTRTWLKELQCRTERPTAEQLVILQTIVDRVTVEAAIEQGAKRSDSSTSQPLFDMAHGHPGCGKSRLIAWIREVFEMAARIAIRLLGIPKHNGSSNRG